MTNEYTKALDAHNLASKKFRAAETAFRAGVIDPVDYLAAREAYNAATALFDTAFAAEAALGDQAPETAAEDNERQLGLL